MMSAEQQIEKLATWFMSNAPEQIIEGGAGDVAVAYLEKLAPLVAAAEKWRGTPFDEGGSAKDAAAHNALCDAVDAFRT